MEYDTDMVRYKDFAPTGFEPVPVIHPFLSGLRFSIGVTPATLDLVNVTADAVFAANSVVPTIRAAVVIPRSPVMRPISDTLQTI